LHDFKESAVQVKSDGRKAEIAYMVLEFITGGELFDFVALGAFQEPVCRFYFKQMLQLLHYVHSKGTAHRDLKPENILLDDKFNVKVADFGFAAPI
jgi:serine/threonine protein kinase